MNMKVPFSPPDMTEQEAKLVREAILSGWITTGPKTKQLEKEISDALADPCIVHFTYKKKPWRLYFANSHPFNSTWDKYQNMTKWKGVKYDYRTKSQRIRRYAGNILRRFGLLAPLRQNSKFLTIDPID